MTKNKSKIVFKAKAKKKPVQSRAMVVYKQPQQMGTAPGAASISNAMKYLDAGAIRYLKLLGDPCNEKFTSPPYEGEGSGMYFRTKNLVTSTNVDSVLQFCPNYISQNFDGTASGTSKAFLGPIMIGNGALAATLAITSSSISSAIFGGCTATTVTGGSFSGVRCVAACIRVGYTGTVMNLSGQVRAKLTPQNVFTDVGQTATTFSAEMNDCPQIDDLRSRTHEYRWVPNFEDQNFITTPGYQLSGSNILPANNINGSPDGNTLIVGVTGASAGTITYEVTCVWEAQVKAGGASNLVQVTASPGTNSTLNQVLNAIGNVGHWALSDKGQKDIMGYFRGAGSLVNTVKGGIKEFVSGVF